MGEKVVMSTVLVLLAQAELSQGHATRVRTLLEEGLTIFRAFGHTWGIALVLSLLGRLAVEQGELSQAEAFLTDGARRASSSEINATSRTCSPLAGLAALQEDYETARLRYEEGLATALELKYTSLIASGLKRAGLCGCRAEVVYLGSLCSGEQPSPCASPAVTIPQEIYERMVAVVRTQLRRASLRRDHCTGACPDPRTGARLTRTLLPAG